MLSYHDFLELRARVPDYPSFKSFLSEFCDSIDVENGDTVFWVLKAIYDTKDIRTLRGLTGLSRPEFSVEYMIPKRTIETWEQSKNHIKPHIFEMLLFAVISNEDYRP